MGDYQWTSYVQFATRADAFGRALLTEGVKPGGRVCIFAETRQEWLEAAVGAFTQNITGESERRDVCGCGWTARVSAGRTAPVSGSKGGGSREIKE